MTTFIEERQAWGFPNYLAGNVLRGVIGCMHMSLPLINHFILLHCVLRASVLMARWCAFHYFVDKKFFNSRFSECQMQLLQIEGGMVQKQYIARVAGEFPEQEVCFC